MQLRGFVEELSHVISLVVLQVFAQEKNGLVKLE